MATTSQISLTLTFKTKVKQFPQFYYPLNTLINLFPIIQDKGMINLAPKLIKQYFMVKLSYISYAQYKLAQ